MRVAILGCGAMGTVMGAYLTKNGCPVIMIDNYQAHVDALNEKGAHIVGTVDMTVPVTAINPEQMEGIYDIVFLFTKQLANAEILPKLLPHLNEQSTVCTLQNGVPEPYVASFVGEDRTVGGTVLWGATFLSPGVSELTQDISKNDHLFEIGEIDGHIGGRIQTVAAVLNFMGPTKVSGSLMASRWGKLVNNACMSGMSAVGGCTFAEVLDNETACACLAYIGREVYACAKAEGYTLPELLNLEGIDPSFLNIQSKEDLARSKKLFRDMYDNLRPAKASMLQDLEKGKLTEVNMINGYVCQTGDKHGIDTPFCDKVVEIVTKIEKGELPLSFSNVELMAKDLDFEFGV